MSTQGQIIIIVFAVLMLFFVFELLRRRKIGEGTALWWLVIVGLIIFFTLNQPLLLTITHLMGASIPISVLILLSLAFILLMLIYFSMKISILSNQMKDISQDIAIFKTEVFDNRQKK